MNDWQVDSGISENFHNTPETQVEPYKSMHNAMARLIVVGIGLLRLCACTNALDSQIAIT